MAYMSQDHKAEIAAQLRRVIPAGWKWSLGVHHHSTIVLTISAAPVDLLGESARVSNELGRMRGYAPSPIGTHCDVNHFHLDQQFDDSLETMRAIVRAVNLRNYDNSDHQTDYFDVGHYVSIRIGRWDKPFVFTGAAKAA